MTLTNHASLRTLVGISDTVNNLVDCISKELEAVPKNLRAIRCIRYEPREVITAWHLTEQGRALMELRHDLEDALKHVRALEDMEQQAS